MHPIVAPFSVLFAEVPLAPFAIPLVAIVMGLGLAMLSVYINYRKKKELFTLYHQERMAAIDKGVELPPLPEGVFGDERRISPPRRNLLKGLIWSLGGLFLSIGLYAAEGFEAAFFGLIAVGIGAAYLIYYFLVGRQEAEAFEAERKAKLAETNRPRPV